MATLMVHDLEDAIVERLRVQAAEHGRSEEEEHRDILRRNLLDTEQAVSRAEALAQLAEFRDRTGGRGSPSTSELLAETRTSRLEQLVGKDGG